MFVSPAGVDLSMAFVGVECVATPALAAGGMRWSSECHIKTKQKKKKNRTSRHAQTGIGPDAQGRHEYDR